MPKRRANSPLASTSKQPRDWQAVISEQTAYILDNSFIPSVSCELCASMGEECVMDRSRRYSKCASCTRLRRPCRREFHTGSEWELLKQAEAKVASDLSNADDELEQLQSHLEEVQQKLKSTLARHARLRKQQKFLKERGFKMSEHDAELLRIVDEKSSEQLDPPVVEVQQLAATSSNPDFNQMLEEIAQMPSSFWENVELPSGEIASTSDDNPSSSR